jgi:transposase
LSARLVLSKRAAALSSAVTTARARHGAVNLFAALEVATGKVFTSFTELKRRIEFLEFMDKIAAKTPDGLKVHVIMDNYCIHKKCDEWLAEHPNFKFHFTPTSASWMNMVEIWFGHLTRKALTGASFKDTDELKRAIKDFIKVSNKRAKPYKWKKREVRGSQLRNTIKNLCK